MVTPEPDSAASGTDVATWRRLTGVWPVLAALVLLATLAYLALPSVRAQAQLSLTRQEQAFAELYAVPLDNEGHVGTTCAPGAQPGTTAVVFSVGSHYDDQQDLAYTVRVVRKGGGTYGDGLADRVSVDPGETKTRVVDVPVPAAGRYTVQVALSDSGQYLLLHCGEDDA